MRRLGALILTGLACGWVPAAGQTGTGSVGLVGVQAAPPACSNGVDDDADGRVDFPADLDCGFLDASSELPCGALHGFGDPPLDLDWTSHRIERRPKDARVERISGGWEFELGGLKTASVFAERAPATRGPIRSALARVNARISAGSDPELRAPVGIAVEQAGRVRGRILGSTSGSEWQRFEFADLVELFPEVDWSSPAPIRFGYYVETRNATDLAPAAQYADLDVTVIPEALTCQQFHGETPATTVRYGAAVGVADDLIAVGSSGYPPRIDLYRSVDHARTLEAVLLPDLTDVRGFYSYRLATSSNLLLLGPDSLLPGNVGSVVPLRRKQEGWVQDAPLFSPEAFPDDLFGLALAIGDQTVFVAGTAVTGEGAVYVFRDAGDRLVFEQKLVSPDAVARDRFGGSIAVVGDTLLVGAGYGALGAAYVFRRDGSTWTFERRLLPDAADIVQFGWPVVLSEDFAMVGTYKAFHVYRRGESTWLRLENLRHPGLQGRLEGFAAIHGSRAFVWGSGSGSSALLAYRYDGRRWVLDGELMPVDWDREIYSGGWSVAVNAGTVALVPLGSAAYRNPALYVFDTTTCGDGRLEPGEECDDANFEDGDGCAGSCAIESSPSPAQAACIVSTNRTLAAALRVHHATGVACRSDSETRCTRWLDRLEREAGFPPARRRCDPFDQPRFGFTGVVSPRVEAQLQSQQLFRDLTYSERLGVRDFDYVELASCREALLRAATGLAQAWLDAAVDAKARALSGSGRAVPSSRKELADVLTSALRSGTQGTSRRTAALRLAVERCGDVPLSEALPGCGESISAEETLSCATRVARCRTCRAVEGTDDVSLGCEIFDNGLVDASCEGTH